MPNQGILFNYKLHAMSEGKKEHVSIAICGHVDSGKSTTTGRLIFDLGGVSEREMQKLKDEAERLGKSSFAFAFYMDTQKEERERGVTIACQTKEFYSTTSSTPCLKERKNTSQLQFVVTSILVRVPPLVD
uniref:Tr-type G domain-containing protein n=1 Tax=Chloropicon primus TaxID=1764295 RepID=A0A7S2T2L4_9CHLO